MYRDTKPTVAALCITNQYEKYRNITITETKEQKLSRLNEWSSATCLRSKQFINQHREINSSFRGRKQTHDSYCKKCSWQF